MTRVLARSLARELTYAEIAQVSGGGDPETRATSYCIEFNSSTPDDTAPDFVTPIEVGP